MKISMRPRDKGHNNKKVVHMAAYHTRLAVMLIVMLALLIGLTGCGKNSDDASSSGNSEKTGGGPTATIGSPEDDEADSEDEDSDSSDAVDVEVAVDDNADDETAVDVSALGSVYADVDLTVLSSTMVYGQVYDMLAYYEKYIGKTVKMEGQYMAIEDEDTGVVYHACVIEDATACCTQGFEFIPEGLNYPDDFPEIGENIIVTGTFETYSEGEMLYCALSNATMVVPAA